MTQGYDSFQETWNHIEKVAGKVSESADNLRQRAANHDISKLGPEEKPTLDKLTPLLKETGYGSDRYRMLLKMMKPALDHHYALNDHHPEHYGPNGISDMSLMALIEMLCDWWAASQRHANGSFEESLAENRERFGIEPQLMSILRATAKELDLS